MNKKRDVKKVQTAKKRKNIENTKVSMSVNIRTKVRKTQKIEFFCKILFFATDKIRPRRTPVFSKFASEFGAKALLTPCGVRFASRADICLF